MQAERDLLIRAYEAFNRRDALALTPLFHADVEWPDILEGGVVSGRQAVFDYYARQFETMEPDARIIDMRDQPPQRVVVDIQYAVRDLQGNLWSDTQATLAYDFRDGLISRLTVLEGL